MGETPKFFLLVALATVLASILMVRNRSIQSSRAMARGFYYLCVFLSGAALLLSILSPFGLLHGELYLRAFRFLIFRGWIVVGTAVPAAAFLLLGPVVSTNSRANSPAVRKFASSRYVLHGICISIAISFLCTEIGKLTHDAEMRQFFLHSGYAVWFLYFEIGCEILGAIAC